MKKIVIKVLVFKRVCSISKVLSNYTNTGYMFFNHQLRPFLNLRLGIDYYPTELKRIGFRATFSGDTTIESKTLWQVYSLFYLGVEYKF